MNLRPLRQAPNGSPVANMRFWQATNCRNPFADSRRAEVTAIFLSDILILHVLGFRQIKTGRNFRFSIFNNSRHVIYLGDTCWKSRLRVKNSLSGLKNFDLRAIATGGRLPLVWTPSRRTRKAFSAGRERRSTKRRHRMHTSDFVIHCTEYHAESSSFGLIFVNGSPAESFVRNISRADLDNIAECEAHASAASSGIGPQGPSHP